MSISAPRRFTMIKFHFINGIRLFHKTMNCHYKDMHCRLLFWQVLLPAQLISINIKYTLFFVLINQLFNYSLNLQLDIYNLTCLRLQLLH